MSFASDRARRPLRAWPTIDAGFGPVRGNLRRATVADLGTLDGEAVRPAFAG